jgi:hypothetical protein
MIWMETQEFPFPDFSIDRKCRDINTLIKWRDEKAAVVDTEKYKSMKKPKNINEIPAPREYYELFNETNST